MMLAVDENPGHASAKILALRMKKDDPWRMKIDPKQAAENMRQARSRQPRMTSEEMRAQVNQHQRATPIFSPRSADKPSVSSSGRRAAAIS